MFHKKQYERVARLINDLDLEEDAKYKIAFNLIEMFEEDNPNFSSDIFIRECGLENFRDFVELGKHYYIQVRDHSIANPEACEDVVGDYLYDQGCPDGLRQKVKEQVVKEIFG